MASMTCRTSVAYCTASARLVSVRWPSCQLLWKSCSTTRADSIFETWPRSCGRSPCCAAKGPRLLLLSMPSWVASRPFTAQDVCPCPAWLLLGLWSLANRTASALFSPGTLPPLYINASIVLLLEAIVKRNGSNGAETVDSGSYSCLVIALGVLFCSKPHIVKPKLPARRLYACAEHSRLIVWAGSMQLRDLSSIAWSLATLDSQDGSMGRWIREVVLSTEPLSRLSGQDIANLLWACCKIKLQPPGLDKYTVSLAAPDHQTGCRVVPAFSQICLRDTSCKTLHLCRRE